LSELQGPRGSIPYARDALGYPSIRARDRVDVAFAHGWFAAVDRAVQVHISLWAGEGRLLEVLGETPVARTMDHTLRALNLTGDAPDEAARLSPEMRAITTAWCDGFNAGAAHRGRPLVLSLLRQPLRVLTPRDVIVIYRMASFFGLTSLQLTGEAALTEMLARGGDERLVRILLGDAAAVAPPELVAGADLSALGWFPPIRRGSNAVAVAASRSKSGHALLVGQPHMEVGRFPPVLYALHADLADGSAMSGVGLPGLSWFSYCRTDHAAWGYTYGHADNVDILVEEVRDGCYRAGSEWRPLTRREERVKTKAGEETWVFWDSPYGVVLGDATKPGKLPCLRWAGLHGTNDLNAVPRMEQARDVEAALAAQAELAVISLHAVVADKAGRIGYTLTGRVDERPQGWSGAGPAAGWSREDRDPAPLPEASRPRRLDPPAGLLVSANERVDGPDGTRWVTLPEPRWRHDRLTERLSALPRIGLDDLHAAMHDQHDGAAAAMLPIWAPHLDDPAFHALCAWAGRADHPDRARHLGRFHALHDELIRGLLEPSIGAEGAAVFLDELYLGMTFQWHIDPVLMLEKPDLLDANGLAALLAAAWPRSEARAAKIAADVPVRAKFHNLFFPGKLPGFLGFDSPEVAVPGGPVSPFQSRRAAFRGEHFVFGPGAEFLVDLGQRGCWYSIPGGASESRFGPGYGKGVEEWLRGDLFPLGGAPPWR